MGSEPTGLLPHHNGVRMARRSPAIFRIVSAGGLSHGIKTVPLEITVTAGGKTIRAEAMLRPDTLLPMAPKSAIRQRQVSEVSMTALAS